MATCTKQREPALWIKHRSHDPSLLEHCVTDKSASPTVVWTVIHRPFSVQLIVQFNLLWFHCITDNICPDLHYIEWAINRLRLTNTKFRIKQIRFFNFLILNNSVLGVKLLFFYFAGMNGFVNSAFTSMNPLVFPSHNAQTYGHPILTQAKWQWRLEKCNLYSATVCSDSVMSTVLNTDQVVA